MLLFSRVVCLIDKILFFLAGSILIKLQQSLKIWSWLDNYSLEENVYKNHLTAAPMKLNYLDTDEYGLKI